LKFKYLFNNQLKTNKLNVNVIFIVLWCLTSYMGLVCVAAQDRGKEGAEGREGDWEGGSYKKVFADLEGMDQGWLQNIWVLVRVWVLV
jgi:hypothetical protein